MGVKGKLLTLFVVIVLMITLAGVVSASQLTDINNHWAEKQIAKWVSDGLVTGYPDNTFRPGSDITRAEFVVLVNRAYGFSEKAEISFTDVKSGDWFAAEIQKAQAAGYVNGYDDGTFGPNKKISRQEAAAMLARLLKLDGSQSDVSKFSDKANIPQWSKNFIGAVAAKGYMGGYPDGTLQPAKSITRAETVTTLDRAVGTLFNSAGIFGSDQGTKTITGNVTVNVADVTIKNTIISGDLILVAGIGNGDVELDNVTVKGTTLVSGGGENSVVINNSSLSGELIVYRVNGKVRVVAKGTTSIDSVRLESAAKLEEDSLTGTGFKDVGILVIKPGEEIELEGDFENVSVETNADVQITGTSKVAKLTVNEDGEGAEIQVATGASVNTLTLKAKVTVTGKGTISKLVANEDANGSKIEQSITNITISGTATLTINGKDVSKSTSTGGGGGGGGGHDDDDDKDVNEETVNNIDELAAALVDENVETIILAADIDLQETLVIDREDLTIQGNTADKTRKITGNVNVEKTEVTLKNMTIDGDFTAGIGIGDGDVTLDNVEVTGASYFDGGGEHSAHLNGETVLGAVYANAEGLHINAEEGASICGTLTLNAGATLTAPSENVFSGDIVVGAGAANQTVTINAPVSASVNITINAQGMTFAANSPIQAAVQVNTGATLTGTGLQNSDVTVGGNATGQSVAIQAPVNNLVITVPAEVAVFENVSGSVTIEANDVVMEIAEEVIVTGQVVVQGAGLQIQTQSDLEVNNQQGGEVFYSGTGTVTGNNVVYTLPAPELDINYQNGTISVSEDMYDAEYKVDLELEWHDVDGAVDVDLADSLIKIRYKQAPPFTAAGITALVTARAEAPVIGIDYTAEATIQAITSAMERSASENFETSQPGMGLRLKLTPGETLYFRYRATNSSFASQPYELVVPVRPAAASFTGVRMSVDGLTAVLEGLPENAANFQFRVDVLGNDVWTGWSNLTVVGTTANLGMPANLKLKDGISKVQVRTKAATDKFAGISTQQTVVLPVTEPSITAISVANGEITITFSGAAPAGLALADFEYGATLDGEAYTLENPAYAEGKITFDAVTQTSAEQVLAVSIGKSEASTLLSEGGAAASVTIPALTVTKPSITAISVTNGEITITLSGAAPAGLALADFEYGATLDGEAYTLKNVAYADGKITFDAVAQTSAEQVLAVEVGKAETSTLLSEGSATDSVTIPALPVTKPSITAISITNGEITITLSGATPAGLALADFEYGATLDGVAYTLENPAYADGKITFDAVAQTSAEQVLAVEVGKAETSTKLSEGSATASVTIPALPSN
ncbi:Cellulosome-anchoring protein precursor [Pelotomaculum schinkii]|uniref:Cellulosome-anchoring protein n=1 Tax=Pelotomaculum schinkii TaxID=78350 RepID=A0A4Y7RCY2_9FIRM|nr:S-layer homology domain-containing protein [Pelotomaculum schinkii]TEB06686.1 Cellulosome-anchoring protein precursor [Pelotomaculum schinkii]